MTDMQDLGYADRHTVLDAEEVALSVRAHGAVGEFYTRAHHLVPDLPLVRLARRMQSGSGEMWHLLRPSAAITLGEALRREGRSLVDEEYQALRAAGLLDVSEHQDLTTQTLAGVFDVATAPPASVGEIDELIAGREIQVVQVTPADTGLLDPEDLELRALSKLRRGVTDVYGESEDDEFLTFILGQIDAHAEARRLEIERDGVRESGFPLGRAATFIKQQGEGTVSVAYNGTEWVAGLTFGREAPDSDMAGGAAYGTGETAGQALDGALRDAGA